MTVTVLVKDLKTEIVTIAEIFETREEAVEWMEDMMSIWEEECAYKIEENEDA